MVTVRRGEDGVHAIHGRRLCHGCRRLLPALPMQAARLPDQGIISPSNPRQPAVHRALAWRGNRGGCRTCCTAQGWKGLSLLDLAQAAGREEGAVELDDVEARPLITSPAGRFPTARLAPGRRM